MDKATLKTALQAAFNKAYTGVVAQGKKSQTVGANCAYRSEGASCAYRSEGAKCNVGHIIPDSHYKEEFDSGACTGVESLLDSLDLGEHFAQALIAGGIPDPQDRVVRDFLAALQEAHDDVLSVGDFVKEFKQTMAGVAYDYGLEIPGETV